MATVRDLITGAMRELGAIAISEAPTAFEMEDGLQALNEMLGTWRTESLMVFARNQDVFTLATGQQYYTVGPGGDINMAERPVSIEAAYMRDPNTNDLDVYVCTSFQDYADIISKTATSSLITAVYYDATVPLGKLYVWPVFSDSSYRLVLWTWGVLSEYTSVDTVLVLPPGYLRAMRTNLAVDLAARYGKPVASSLAVTAAESKAQLKRTNADIPTLTFDRGLGGSGVTFNYLTGQPT